MGRSRELGDLCGFCARCGWGRRYMAGNVGDVPATCPDCGGAVLTACPACAEPIESIMSVACRACGEPLRDPVAFGVEIRRKPERGPRAPRDGACAVVDGEPAVADNVGAR